MKKVFELVLLALFVAAPVFAADKDVRQKDSEKIIASMHKAAEFLKANQNPDGGWGAAPRGSDVGITGLVVEGLARAPKEVREKYKNEIEKGVAYILANRREDGAIVNKDNQVANYRTSISTHALMAVDREKYKDTIDAAVKYTKGIQGVDEKDKAKYGSMGYGSDQSKGDIINTGEALEMLKAAGVKEDDEVYKRALTFLGRTQNLDEFAEPGVKTTNDGGAIYRSIRDVEKASQAGTLKLPDGTEVPRSYGGATYNLLKSYIFAGMKRDNPRVVAAYNWIAENYSVSEHPFMGKQGLFYFYYTMGRTLEVWGSPRIKSKGVDHFWPSELALQVIKLQKEDGSWVNDADRWWESDKSLVTAYSLNTLRICLDMFEK